MAAGGPEAAGPAKPKFNWGAFLFKAVVTSALVIWLVQSEALNFERLRLLISSAEVLVVTIGVWTFVTVGLSTLRWRILLETVGVQVGWMRGLGLQAMALFFNGLVPGNIGGDFLKNHAMVGNRGGTLVVLVLLERIVGVISLVWTAVIGLALSWERFSGDTRLSGLATGVAILVAMSIIGPLVVLKLLPAEPGAGPTSKSPGAIGWIISAFRGAWHSGLETLRLVRGAPASVARAFLASLAMHLGNMTYFLYLTWLLGNADADLGQIALAFPLGMLSIAVPISISGMGVGHAAFNWLFEVLGLQHGADVFNLYLIALLTPSILGAIPYVFMRSRGAAVRAP